MPRSDLPGIPTAPDEDWVNGQIEALRRDMREYQASLMEAVGDAIASIVWLRSEKDDYSIATFGTGTRTISDIAVPVPVGATVAHVTVSGRGTAEMAAAGCGMVIEVTANGSLLTSKTITNADGRLYQNFDFSYTEVLDCSAVANVSVSQSASIVTPPDSIDSFAFYTTVAVVFAKS